jgi:serine protease Do
MRGELVGIVQAKSSGIDIEGLGFAAPVDIVKSVVDQIMQHGFVRGRVDTGLNVVDVQDIFTASAYRVSRYGLYIASADNDMFQPFDLILEINGENIRNLADYNAILDRYSVGDVITVTIARSSGRMTIPITLEEKTQP